ncbi:hypothetical protein H9X85_05325 [Anaerotignum lactatifermentans]|uniref:Uncharacterized protein n=1 Tax=Anaerotignum lactatifermentans TaxID=160404 RepID=A0ABS2G896_9FIRM|nr:hypothetical protein [Anaerotignum lactatifermentans]MBM6829132.1 hypothetical protein [Anaerotignum lactatifermentans]MBM6877260.1 hypothetical protein [Anaerotignum lactatifermentans]MBM6950633.1 hypothetical protein [Anaerotignum lactatifermentans]
MLTIYTHRKKVMDIICMVYALMFSNMTEYCNQMRGKTFDIKWAYAAFGLMALYFLVLYLFTQICDWKMAAVNLLVLVAALLIRNGVDGFYLIFVESDFTMLLFMVFILCHRGYEARKKTNTPPSEAE